MTKIVNWLGTTLGVDADYFVRGGIYGFIQQGIGLICGLIIVYAFGHFVPAAVFGEYNLMLSIISLLAVVSLPGMNTAVLQSVGQGYDQSLTEGVRARFKWSLLGVPLLLAWTYYYKLRGSDVMPTLLILTAALFPLIYPFSLTQAFFVAKKRFGWQAMFASLSSVMTAVLVGGAIVVTGNLFWILMGYFIGTILPSILSLVVAQKLIRPKAKTDPDLLPYGHFLTRLQILPLAAAHVSNILLAMWLGVERLAVFTAASKFPGVVQKNWDVFYKPVTAKLAGQTAKQQQTTVKRHLAKFVILGGVLWGVTWLALPMLIRLFFSAEYTGVVNYGRWYSLILLTLPLSWLFNDVITFQKRRRAIFILQTLLPLAKLVIFVVVIPRFQIGGLIAIMLAERIIATAYSGIVVLIQK